MRTSCRKARLTGVVAACLLLAACGGGAGERTVLHDAEIALQRAKADPDVRKFAPGPLWDAEKTLRRAQTESDPDMVYHFAYLAQKKVEIATSIANAQLSMQGNRSGATPPARKPTLLPPNDKPAVEEEPLSRRGTDDPTAAAEPAPPVVAEEPTETPPPQEQAAPPGALPDAPSAIESEERRQAREDIHQQLAQEQQLRARARDEAESAAAPSEDELGSEFKAREDSRGAAFVLPDLNFEPESARLGTRGRDKLTPLVQYLQRNPTHKVIVEGYTDNTGNYQGNLRLSADRAEAVKEYLVEQGVSAERVLTLGRGENKPIASNDTQAGRSKNRRVEIVFIETPAGTNVSGKDNQSALTP